MKPNPNLSAAEPSNVRARVSALREIYERELSEFAAELAKHLGCAHDVADAITRQMPTLRRCIRDKNLERVLRDKSKAAFQKNRYEKYEKAYRARKKSVENLLTKTRNLRAECAAQKIVAAVAAADQLIVALEDKLAFIEAADPMENGTRYGTPFELRRQIANELRDAVPPQHRARFLRALHKVLFGHGADIDLRTLTALTKFPKKISEKS